MKKHKKPVQAYRPKIPFAGGATSARGAISARGATSFVGIDESLIQWGLLLILIATPLIIDPRFSSIELTKAVWMWVISCVCLLIWSVRAGINAKLMILRIPINIPLIAFLLSCILSTCFSLIPHLSLYGEYKRHEGLLTLINYAILCCLCIHFVRETALFKKWLMILVCVGGIAAVCGILQPFGIDLSRWGSGGVPISFFGNQNYAGGYMAMVIFFGLGLLLENEGRGQKIFIGINSLLIYVCLIITKNRGGFLGLLAGLMVFIVLNRAEIWKRRKTAAIYGLIFLLATIGLCLHEKTSPLPKLTSTIRIVQSQGKEKIEAAGTFANRIQIWKTTLHIIRDNPIFGIGIDAFRMAATKHETPEFIHAEGGYNVLIDKAHNEMLDIAATRGLVGLLVYLWVLVSFFVFVGRLWKRMEYPDKWLVSSGIAAIISYLIQNEVGFGVVPTSILFWVLIGGIIGIGVKATGHSYSTIKISLLLRIGLPIFFLLLSIIIIRYSFFACRADIYYKNALALSQRQDTDQAIYMYEKALSYNPNEEFYYGEMLAAYSLISERSRDSLNLLIKRAEDAVRVNPHHAYYYNVLSSSYGKAYVLYNDTAAREKAVDACAHALKLKPLFADPHNNLAAIFVHENRYKEAMDEIGEAIKIYPEHAEYWRILGELQLQQGLEIDGISSLEKAVKYDSNLVSARASLGKFYFKAGFLLKAEEMMKQAVLLVPDNPGYHGDLGSIYFKQGKLDKAAAEFSIALKLSPDNSYFKQMLAYSTQT